MSEQITSRDLLRSEKETATLLQTKSIIPSDNMREDGHLSSGEECTLFG